MWKSALRVESRSVPGRYQELLEHSSVWTRLIRADVPRTFAENPAFDQECRDALQRILLAYSCLNIEVGYCQGMNFVAGLLLLVSGCCEEEAFWAFVCLMENCNLSGFYKDQFPLLKQYLLAMNKLTEEELPDLAAHFAQERLTPNDFVQQWFLTLFVTCLPLPAVLVIWDVILYHGLPVALKVVLALFKTLRCVLLRLSFEDVLAFFRALKNEPEFDAVECRAIGQRVMKITARLIIPPHIAEQLSEP